MFVRDEVGDVGGKIIGDPEWLKYHFLIFEISFCDISTLASRISTFKFKLCATSPKLTDICPHTIKRMERHSLSSSYKVLVVTISKIGDINILWCIIVNFITSTRIKTKVYLSNSFTLIKHRTRMLKLC